MDSTAKPARPRPHGPRAPSLSINTSTATTTTSLPIPVAQPTTPTHSRSHSRSPSSFNLASLNPLKLSTNSSSSNNKTDNEDTIISPNTAANRSHAISKGKAEARKLLSHLLHQLKLAINDKGGLFKPPKPTISVQDSSSPRRRSAHNGPTSRFNDNSDSSSSDSDKDDNNSNIKKKKDEPAKSKKKAHHDPAAQMFELLLQLRDALVLAQKQQWNLFASDDNAYSMEEFEEPSPTSPSSPRTRFMRSSFSQAVQSVTSPSSTSPTRTLPSQQHIESASGATLLNSTLDILTQVCLLAADPLPAFRPSMPPLALQSISLDVAVIILKTTSGRPRDSAAVATSMLGGLQCWGEGMKGRLLAFFEGYIVQSLEQRARRFPNSSSHPNLTSTGLLNFASTGKSDFSSAFPVPAIAIQVDEPPQDSPFDNTDPFGQGGRRRSSSGAGAGRGGRPSPNPTLDIGNRAHSSSYAGDQPLAMYHLTALVAPLLSAALSTISPLKSSMDTLFRLHRLLETLVAVKDDLYLDLIEIVAYGDSPERFGALQVLTNFWPKATGQPSIANPFPPLSYRDDVYRLEKQTMKIPSRPSEKIQHLVPWKFGTTSRRLQSPSLSNPKGAQQDSSRPPSTIFDDFPAPSALPPGVIHAPLCIECNLPVTGFGLLNLSTGSTQESALHLRCHNSQEGSFLTHFYTENGTNRVAAPRFSLVPPPRRAGLVPCDDGPEREKDMPAIAIRVNAHQFRLVNIFTLVVCFLCKEPLWGCVMQGYKCASCKRFAHHKCVRDERRTEFPACEVMDALPIEEITVDHRKLRKQFLSHFKDLIFTEKQLAVMTFEEISVFHMILWAQQQILDAGVASGTIVVKQTGPTKQAREAIDKFELHWLSQLYEAYKASATMPTSAALNEFKALHRGSKGSDGGENSTEDSEEEEDDDLDDPDCYSMPLLVFVAALMRSPVESLSPPDDADANVGHCFDSAQVSLLQDILARDFGLQSELSSRYFLEHVLHLGLIERRDGRLVLFSSTSNPSTSNTSSAPKRSTTSVIFPLPFLIDPSPSVESLVVAIESCLRDLDLSVQEAGLLLLSRRCWPSPFASGYALERLTRAVLRWILDDSILIEVTREQVATVTARYHHHNGHSRTGSASGGITGGADYVAQRKLLVDRLAAKWLKALHDQDPKQYAEFLFRQTATVSAFSGPQDSAQVSKDAGVNEHTVAFTELLLRNLIRLHQSDVVFSTFDNLFSRWLDEVAATWLTLARDDSPLSFRSLVRLFQGQQVGDSRRRSVMMSSAPMVEEPSTTSMTASLIVDSWKVLADTSMDGSAGLRRSLRWLRILAQSGVDASFEVFDHLVTLCASPNVSFDEAVDLAEAMFASAWSRSINRKAMASIAVQLYISQHATVKASLDSDHDTDVTVRFMKRTLGAFLLAMGASSESLIASGFTTEEESKVLGGNRKRHSMLVASATEITCPTEFIDQLTRQCQAEIFQARGVIAKFLYLALAGKQALTSRSAIIKANGGVLSSCVFRLFDLNQNDLTDVRIKLLLVLLSVDGPTFHRLLSLVCVSEAWEHRYTTLDTLFLMISELHIPASGDTSTVSLQQFYPIISHFFAARRDSEEAICQKSATLIQALRPAHLAIMAQSIQAHFNVGNVEDRIKLCGVLMTIRAALPTWQVLSWSTVVDALFAQKLALKEESESEEIVARHEELWLQLLNVALLMVAEGIELDRPSTLVKIKYHVFRALGFENVTLKPSQSNGTLQVALGPFAPARLPSSSLSTLASLKRALDCSKQALSYRDGPPGETAGSSQDLIGSAFLDIIPALIQSGIGFDKFTFLQLRDSLECLSISVFKHNLTGRMKSSVVQSVKTLTDALTSDNTSYDNRILILVTCTSLLRRYDLDTVDILLHQILVVCRAMATHNGDGLWVQGALFIQTAFQKFSTKGLSVLLLKTIPESDENEQVFDVLARVLKDGLGVLEPEGEIPLREAVFYDVFRQILNTQRMILQAVLRTLVMYAAKVHPSDWSLELLQRFVQFLPRLAQHTADFNLPEDFDPNPSVELVLLVLKNHPQHSADILIQLAVLLRAWLPRFIFKRETVTGALEASASAKKNEQASALITSATSEALSDGLRGRTLIHIGTTGALIDALLLDFDGTASLTGQTKQLLSGWSRLVADDPSTICEDAVAFLRAWFDNHNARFARQVFDTMKKAADLVLRAIRLDPACWEVCKGQEAIHTLRTFNMVLLSELSHPSNMTLLRHAPSISTAATLSLRMCLRAPSHAQLSVPIVSEIVAQVFANIRLIIVLSMSRPGREVVEAYWREVWPACEKVLTTNELDGELSAVGLMVWGSFGELIIFLHQAGSPLVLDNASAWSSLLEILRASGRQDSVGSKFTRALASFSDPPRRLQFAQLVDQVTNEVFVAAKLRHQMLQAGNGF
ncbi:hypothetical protein T439DRAFT_381136 [Meredithblackwellia eburnea MCA 4105]